MKKYQAGFSIVEMLVVIFIVGLIGAAGWYVYSQQGDSSGTQATISSPVGDTQESANQKNTVQVKELELENFEGELKTISYLGLSYSLKLPQGWQFSEAIDDFHGESQVRISDLASTFTLALAIQPTTSTVSEDSGNSPQQKSLTFTGVNGKKNYIVNTSVTEPTLPPQLFVSTCEIDFCHNVMEKNKYILGVYVARYDHYDTTSSSQDNMTPINLEDPTVKQILAIVGTITYQEK